MLFKKCADIFKNFTVIIFKKLTVLCWKREVIFKKCFAQEVNNIVQEVSRTVQEMCSYIKKCTVLFQKSFCFCFFLSGFSFTTIHKSQNCRGRRRAFR